MLAVDFESGAIPQFIIEWRPADIEEAVSSLCSTLISFDVESRLVQFAHFSVQEYLGSHRLACEQINIARFHIHEQTANAVMAQTCLSLLLQFNDQIVQDDLRDFPLAHYAAVHWIHHAKLDNIFSCIQDAVRFLFHPFKSHYETWLKIYNMENHWSDIHDLDIEDMGSIQPRSLYYAALYGFHEIVKDLIDLHQQNVNDAGGTCGHALNQPFNNFLVSTV